MIFHQFIEFGWKSSNGRMIEFSYIADNDSNYLLSPFQLVVIHS